MKLRDKPRVNYKQTRTYKPGRGKGMRPYMLGLPNEPNYRMNEALRPVSRPKIPHYGNRWTTRDEWRAVFPKYKLPDYSWVGRGVKAGLSAVSSYSPYTAAAIAGTTGYVKALEAIRGTVDDAYENYLGMHRRGLPKPHAPNPTMGRYWSSNQGANTKYYGSGFRRPIGLLRYKPRTPADGANATPRIRDIYDTRPYPPYYSAVGETYRRIPYTKFLRPNIKTRCRKRSGKRVIR